MCEYTHAHAQPNNRAKLPKSGKRKEDTAQLKGKSQGSPMASRTWGGCSLGEGLQSRRWNNVRRPDGLSL